MKKYSEYLLLLVVLVAGSLLRFHNLGDISFSNDELSAITRARFDTFHELVEKGIKVDGHPALVQTMIWFTIRHFGDDVFTLRFPFAISGILSVFFIFLLARQWFGSATGLLSAAALATLQFPVLYSQTARPYTIGLMFTLVLAYTWTRLLFDERKKTWIGVAYILAFAACLYTHYFSFMLAGIIGASGLFFIRRKNAIQYILLNFIALLTFIPSIPVFRQQFGYEGIGGWLPSPDHGFLKRFLFYGFNESWAMTILFTLLLIVPAFIYFRRTGWNKFQTLSLAWYILPFLTGYCYSVWKAPVLQFSTLIFSFPFLLMFLFSFINEKHVSKNLVLFATLAVLSAGCYSTVVSNKYYQVNHFGVFKELAEETKSWDEHYGNENILKLFTLANPAYINYYFNRLSHTPAMPVFTDEERTMYGKLSAMMDTSHAAYFLYAWTNAAHHYETTVFIRERFPEIVERDTFFNSEITLFKKGKPISQGKLISVCDFESDHWGHETWVQNKDAAHSGIFSQKMDEKTDYSITYRIAASKIKPDASEILRADAWFYATDTLEDAALVIAFEKDGAVLTYTSIPLRSFQYASDKWTNAFVCAEIPKEDCELVVYVWNPKKENFYIDDLSIQAAPRNTLYRP